MREHHECDRSEGVENKNQNIQLLNKFTMFEHVMQVAKMAIRHRTHTSYTRATTAYGQSNGRTVCCVCGDVLEASVQCTRSTLGSLDGPQPPLNG